MFICDIESMSKEYNGEKIAYSLPNEYLSVANDGTCSQLFVPENEIQYSVATKDYLTDILGTYIRPKRSNEGTTESRLQYQFTIDEPRVAKPRVIGSEKKGTNLSLAKAKRMQDNPIMQSLFVQSSIAPILEHAWTYALAKYGSCILHNGTGLKYYHILNNIPANWITSFDEVLDISHTIVIAKNMIISQFKDDGTPGKKVALCKMQIRIPFISSQNPVAIFGDSVTFNISIVPFEKKRKQIANAEVATIVKKTVIEKKRKQVYVLV